MSKIAIIHGTWIPNVDDEKTWELAITPIIQTYSNSNTDRYIPEGRFSLVNTTDQTDMEKAVNETYSFSTPIVDLVRVLDAPLKSTMWGFTQPSSLTMHNLGSASDDGIEYDIYLMIPSSLTASLRDQCFAWGGMISVAEIQVDHENDFEKRVFELIKQVRFGE